MTFSEKIADWRKRKEAFHRNELPRGRMETCQLCQFYRNGWCAKCGCRLSIKTRIMEAHCPLNKW